MVVVERTVTSAIEAQWNGELWLELVVHEVELFFQRWESSSIESCLYFQRRWFMVLVEDDE